MNLADRIEGLGLIRQDIEVLRILGGEYFSQIGFEIKAVLRERRANDVQTPNAAENARSFASPHEHLLLPWLHRQGLKTPAMAKDVLYKFRPQKH